MHSARTRGSTIIIISREPSSLVRIDLVVMGVVPFHDNDVFSLPPDHIYRVFLTIILLKKSDAIKKKKTLLKNDDYTHYVHTIGNVPSVTNQRTIANNSRCRTSRLLGRLGVCARELIEYFTTSRRHQRKYTKTYCN